MKKIFMIGDSTMQYNNIYAYPQTGWGQLLHMFVKNDCLVEVHAKNGRSSKSFIEEGLFEEVLRKLEQGDAIICQFGHNDEKLDEERHTTPNGTYLDNLAYFAACAKEKGAHIVFATSISRRLFKDGVCYDSHQGYPQAMLNWAKENGHTCIDLNQITLDLYNKIGEENAKSYHMIFGPNIYPNYPEGKLDNSHLNHAGAMMICEIFSREIAKTNHPIKSWFHNLEKKEEIDERMLID